jgi:hypothetical protein
MKNSKKVSFPIQGKMFKKETTNGYYNPTSIPAKIQAKKNAKAVATRMRMAEAGFQARQVSTRSNEPVQSESFKKGK